MFNVPESNEIYMLFLASHFPSNFSLPYNILTYARYSFKIGVCISVDNPCITNSLQKQEFIVLFFRVRARQPGRTNGMALSPLIPSSSR